MKLIFILTCVATVLVRADIMDIKTENNMIKAADDEFEPYPYECQSVLREFIMFENYIRVCYDKFHSMGVYATKMYTKCKKYCNDYNDDVVAKEIKYLDKFNPKEATSLIDYSFIEPVQNYGSSSCDFIGQEVVLFNVLICTCGANQTLTLCKRMSEYCYRSYMLSSKKTEGGYTCMKILNDYRKYHNSMQTTKAPTTFIDKLKKKLKKDNIEN